MTTALPDLDGLCPTGLISEPVVDRLRAEQAASLLLQALGVVMDTEVGRNTPLRMAEALEQLLTPEPFTFTTFANAEDQRDLVLTHDISFTSLCAHHLLPFSGVAHVGIHPADRLPGLSKIARTVQAFAAKLQTQEGLGQEIAAFLQAQLACAGVGVVLQAEHLCMTSRGARAVGANTVTVATLGRLQDDHGARAEFLQLAMRNGRTA